VKGMFLFVIAMPQQRCMNMISVHIFALVVFFLLEFMCFVLKVDIDIGHSRKHIFSQWTTWIQSDYLTNLYEQVEAMVRRSTYIANDIGQTLWEGSF
jgi:hypothetical protein